MRNTTFSKFTTYIRIGPTIVILDYIQYTEYLLVRKYVHTVYSTYPYHIVSHSDYKTLAILTKFSPFGFNYEKRLV